MHAYGIPILTSGLVKDETLRRACYTVRFMLADREDIRRAQYFNGGRIVIMAEYPLEKTTDVPVRVPRAFARWSNFDSLGPNIARGIDSPVVSWSP